MDIQGRVVDVDDPRTVETAHGQSELVEVAIAVAGEEKPRTVTLWGKWTATQMQPGMDIAVYDVSTKTFNGEIQYATTGDSLVIIEPSHLVDVTAIRAWVQCPRIYYLNKLTRIPLKYPVIKGNIVHEVFGDILRGRDPEASLSDRIAEFGVELGLLHRDQDAVRADIDPHVQAITGWLAQRSLGSDSWRSEQTLISSTFGLKGRADAIRRGAPVELKTGKNVSAEPRFHDKVQAACYALLLADGLDNIPDTGTLLYTRNAELDRAEEGGDLSPAKDFSLNPGLLKFIIRTRNELVAMEHARTVPTGHEADAICEYCFEQDTCMAVAGRLDQPAKAGQLGQPLPSEERIYFSKLYEALETEREAIHTEYRKLWNQSPAERLADDRALIDLDPVDQTQIENDQWKLIATRTSAAVSKIQEGDLVLASDGDPIDGHAELARVESLSEHVVVTTPEPLDLRRIDVYPSEIGIDRSLTALHEAILQGDRRRRDLLFERSTPQFTASVPASIESVIDEFELNPSQRSAVNQSVVAEDFALIHGPPGTGKTYTLAHIVKALLTAGNRILVAAFTNRAVDNAIEAIETEGITDIVRWGTETGIRDDMQKYRFDGRGDPHERADLLESAQIVATTTASCGTAALSTQAFDVAIIDEAGQLTPPGTFLATNRADRFVLIGDHQQLPPVVQSATAGEDEINPLETSLFETLIEQYPDASILLNRQYRMNQRIQYFSNQEFYAGKLRPASGNVAAQQLTDLDGVGRLPTKYDNPVTFIDPAGSAIGNTNPTEAQCIEEIVSDLRNCGVPAAAIGVIAPYRAQVAEISKHLSAVTVDTVDRFQGSAKEVIILSFVETDALDSPIFEDHRRVNVALTRAKKSVILVGDRTALSTTPFYRRLLTWADHG